MLKGTLSNVYKLSYLVRSLDPSRFLSALNDKQWKSGVVIREWKPGNEHIWTVMCCIYFFLCKALKEQNHFVRLLLALSLAQLPKSSCFYLSSLFVFSLFVDACNLFKCYTSPAKRVWSEFSHYSTDPLTPQLYCLFLKSAFTLGSCLILFSHWFSVEVHDQISSLFVL